MCIYRQKEDKGGKVQDRDQTAMISLAITGCKKPSIVENDMYRLEMLPIAGNSCLNRINVT